jgi:hypothetical protein
MNHPTKFEMTHCIIYIIKFLKIVKIGSKKKNFFFYMLIKHHKLYCYIVIDVKYLNIPKKECPEIAVRMSGECPVYLENVGNCTKCERFRSCSM